MSYPGLSGTSEGKRIGMRNALVLDDELASLEMPPDVRIGDIARRHGEQAEEQHRQENVLCAEQSVHRGLIITGGQCSRYSFGPRTTAESERLRIELLIG